ncbi:MAG: dimethylamine monooxygenase subunit DmmA family protein [Alsobacter sp.]
MPATTTFKSRPTYARLTPRPGLRHLLVADEAGGPALLDLVQSAPADFAGHCRILLAAPGVSDCAVALSGLGALSFATAPGVAAILPRLRQMLATARMGTRLYVAGAEGLIGQATALALEAGMETGAIQAEHRGSLARRVQCVHCKGVTENVVTQPARCAHCGLTLLVRDHWSRRLGAFQGVCIDAEEPGSAPPTEEAFA